LKKICRTLKLYLLSTLRKVHFCVIARN